MYHATIASISNLRTNTDMLIQFAATRKTSAKLTAAWRSLQMAKCWIGVLKAELYAHTHELNTQTYTQATEIPPTDDVYNNAEIVASYSEIPLLDFVNNLRENINVLMEKANECAIPRPFSYNMMRKATDYMQKAHFYYGFELADLRAAALIEAQKQADLDFTGTKWDCSCNKGDKRPDYILPAEELEL